MKTKTISEICLVNPRMPTSLASQKDRDVDFVPMANVGEDGRITVNGPRKLHEVQKGYTYFQNGDVIVAKITPCMENGKAAYVRNLPNEVGFGSTEFHVLRPQDGLDPAYLFHMIWSSFFRREAGRNMTGTAGQQRVPTSFFERFKIPLPSLPEQRRIADILDKADAIQRKRQEAQNMAGQLRRSLYLSTFGDPIANPLKWDVKQFSDVCVRMHQGINTVADKVEYTEAGYPIIQSKHFTKGALDLSDTRFVSVSDYARYRDKYAPQPNDLLVANIGTIGKTFRILNDAEFLIAWNVFLVKLNQRAISPRYAQCFLEELATRQFFDQFMTGGTVKFINKTTMGNLPIPMPPMSLQITFEKQLKSIDLILGHEIEGHRDTEILFHSLVQRAFRGEL